MAQTINAQLAYILCKMWNLVYEFITEQCSLGNRLTKLRTGNNLIPIVSNEYIALILYCY